MDKFTYDRDVEICLRISDQDPEKFHMQTIDLEHLDFTRPTVLCFSGNGTTQNKDANGLASQAERYLDLLFKARIINPQTGHEEIIQPTDRVDIMSVRYASRDNYSGGYLTEQSIEQLASAMLRLLTDSNGNRLSLKQAQQNMSRLTFFTFCAGNKELQNVINRLNQKLAQVDYHEDEIYAINNASLEVSYAPYNSLYNRIPSVRVSSKRDYINPIRLYESNGILTAEQSANLDGIYLRQDVSGALEGIPHDKINPLRPSLPIDTATAPSIQIVSSKLLNTIKHNDNEHYVAILARDKDWNLKPFQGKHISPNADCVSQMMAWALCKGVENSMQNFASQTYIPNTYWNEMLDDFQSIINSFSQEQLSVHPHTSTDHTFEK